MGQRRLALTRSGLKPVPASILNGLMLTRGPDELEINYPAVLHSLERAAVVAEPLGLDIEPAADKCWRVRVPVTTEESPYRLASRFFSRLNGFPEPYDVSPADYVRPANPRVSCIVVLNENLPFVARQLIPSLVANSGPNGSVEIIVAWNGAADPTDMLGAVQTVAAPGVGVAASYNAGVAAARASHVALFHDDVVVDDPQWIDKGLVALENGAGAVSPEMRQLAEIGGVAVPPLPIAKNVPLMLSRRDYDDIGGYDERHLLGYEDLDFTLALLARMMPVRQVDLNVRHFHGMSSTLKYGNMPGLAELYGCMAVPRHAVKAYFIQCVERLSRRGAVDHFKLLKDIQLLYVLRKHRDFLYGVGARPFHKARLRLERAIRDTCPAGLEPTISLLKELDAKSITE
jgi:hypothetical protein